MSLPGDGSSLQLEDHWVQCDRCNKWRRVPREVADGLVDDAEWYCELNPNAQFASCSVLQELTNEEIDQEAAEAEEEQQNLPKLPAVWQLIQGNYYSHRKRKQQDEDDIMVCHCPPPWRGGDGCGPNCINRMLCIECTEDFCPCENQCNNQMFTKKQYAKLAVRRAGPKGFGLYAEEDVAAGQFLIEYIGEVLEEEEYIRRKQYYIGTGQRHYYFMNIGNGEVIDACRKGNHARFINHSCEPNCETQKWMVRGELAIGLYTLRKIKAGEELTFDYNFERYGDKPMRCFCGSKKCRKFIGGTQESTANIVELGDAEDVTNDPEPVMVREEETDAMVQAMLDKEVGTTQRAWDNKLLNRLQQLCQQKGIDWSLPEEAEGRTASTQQAAGAASPSQQESEDGSRAAALASTSAGLSHAQAAASPASSSAPGGDAAKAGLDGASSPPPTVRGPLKAAFKQLKRKRGAAQDEEAAAAAAAKKLAAQQRKHERQQQLEKRRLKQQEEFIRRQLLEERRLQKLHEKQLEQQRKQQARQELLQQKKQQRLAQRQQQGQSEDDDDEEEEDEAQESSSSEQPEEEEDEDEQQQEDEDLEDSDDGEHAARQGVHLTDADLEDDMSDDDMLPARPAPVPVSTNRRVRVVPSSRRRPPLAPGTKAAADGGKQKGATTASGRRSFLTLAVSTVGKQVKRRSEVDRRLEQLVAKQSFRLKEPGQQSVIKVLRMFNLCDIAPRQADPLVQQQLALHQQQQQQQQGGSKQGSPIKRSENGEAWQQQQLQRQASGSQQLEPQQQQQSDAAGGSVLPQQDGVQDMHIDQAAGGTATEQCLPQLPAHLQPLQPLRGAELEARERESEARFKARQRARMADLGMLLDVVLASSSEKLKKEWVTCGILTQLQQTLTRLPMTQEYSVVLVKVIRVLEHLPVTPDDLYTARSAHGTFADLIRRMASSASDWEVRRRSHQLLKRYAASSCSDATLLQLYHVPGPNNKPYLLGLHLPPAQVSRLLALLPKNAPPPHQAGRRGEKRHVQQQQQQYRGERGFLPGAPGVMPGHPGPPPPGMAGLEPQQQQQQHSSPSTSHGATLAGDRPAGPGATPGSPPGGSTQLPHWRAAALAAAGNEELQLMQGNRPLGRGGSSSQLAADGWDAGPPPPGGPWGPGPPPPGFHLPPAGASGVFRQNRHSRHLQQRSPGGPFPAAPPGSGPPGRAGPPGPAGGRVGPPFGPPPPDANNGWHAYHGRFGASPGGYGPGAFDGPGRDWERDREREREWDSWDRQREWDRERERDRDQLDMQDGRPPRYCGVPEAAAKRSRWEQEPGSQQQQQSPGEPMLEQQQRGMPPISDLWAEAAAGGGLPHDSSARSSSRMVRSGSGVRMLELAGPDDAAAAGMDPGSGSGPWQHQPDRPPSRGRHTGWEQLPPSPHQQQQHGAGEPAYGRQGPNQQQQQRLLRHQPASVEELCSIGLYAYHQLGDESAGDAATASAAAWLRPPASPRAAEAAARGSLSPIISGRFSPPLHDSWLAGRARPLAPKLPPAGDGLGMEDVFCLLQDAVVADRTPGVAMSAVLAAGEQPGPPGRQQAPTGPHDSSSKQRPPQQQQQQQGFWRGPGGGADGFHSQQQQQPPAGYRGPAAARELPPNARLPQPPQQQQQQQQQFPDTWDEPGPEFEAFVGDAVKRRLGKYVQPDHPNRISKEDAQSLYRKLRREVYEKEVCAFSERTAGGAFKPIERSKLEQNIKEFVRLSIRRMRAARTAPGPGSSMQAGLGPAGMMLPGMREPISGQLM